MDIVREFRNQDNHPICNALRDSSLRKVDHYRKYFNHVNNVKFRLLDHFLYWNGKWEFTEHYGHYDLTVKEKEIKGASVLLFPILVNNVRIYIVYEEINFFIYGSYIVNDTLVFCGKPNVKTILDLAQKDIATTIIKFYNVYNVDISAHQLQTAKDANPERKRM